MHFFSKYIFKYVVYGPEFHQFSCISMYLSVLSTVKRNQSDQQMPFQLNDSHTLAANLFIAVIQ